MNAAKSPTYLRAIVGVAAILALASACSTSTPSSDGGTTSGASSVTSSNGTTSAAGSSAGSTSSGSSSGGQSSSGSGTTNGGGSTTTGQGTTSGTGTSGAEAWVWVYTDYANSLDAVSANSTSFTHVSPGLYHMNYDYQSGVPSFSSGPSGGCASQPVTTDSFDGLTSTQIAGQIHAMGLKVVPLIYGGAANCGTDQGIENVLNDSPAGTQSAFINALVGEAQAKGYDGWNLDWETHLDASPYASLLITFLGAAHSAFAAQGLSLTLDILASNAEQSYCSGGSGFVDLDSLGPVVDGVVIEAYESSLASQSSSCPSGLPNPLPCNYPSATACPSGECVASDLALVCAHLPASKVVIGLDAVPGASNPIAGSALSTIESYGFKRVAVWPDGNTDGPSGGYAFLDSSGITPTDATWYTLLQGFLTHWGG